MKINLRITVVLLVISLQCFSQTDSAANTQATIQTYYRLAMQYKDGNGVKMDYARAYNYFKQAAALGDAQSIYSLGYMYYKGMGCVQDYAKAASFFRQGAVAGRDNSMYFLGLCFRNGYGVEKNEDSAKYWLVRADSLGYGQAGLELKAIVAENGNDSIKALVQQIKNAAVPASLPLNTFTAIPNSLPAPGMIAGQYGGWLVQYDWSGQNVVSAKRLLLTLSGKDNKFSGTWLEGTDTAVINAELHSDRIEFNHSKYKRTDHYSPTNAVAYSFQTAQLNMLQQADSLFLAGNVTMFSPDRNEPSKPLFVVLARKVEPDNLTSVQVSPNPFVSTLNVNFHLGIAANIEVQLVSLNGTVVYRNVAGKLQAGNYRLPLQPGQIAAGSYYLNVVYGNKATVVKVLKVE